MKRFYIQLTNPYPPDLEIKRNLWFGLGLAVFVVLFTLQFSSITPENVGPRNWVLYSAAFGCLCFVIFILNLVVMPRLFPSFFDESNWKVYREISFAVWNFLTIAMGNAALVYGLGLAELSFKTFLVQLCSTVFIGSIPLSIYVLITHNQLLKKNLQEAAKLNEIISSQRDDDAAQGDVITLRPQADEVYRVDVDNILYAVSEKNYVRVVEDEGHQTQDIVIRSTLSALQESLSHYPFLLRCHRAFIVNTKRIKTIRGNAQGYKLLLEGSNELVPVSRKYTHHFKQFLESRTV